MTSTRCFSAGTVDFCGIFVDARRLAVEITSAEMDLSIVVCKLFACAQCAFIIDMSKMSSENSLYGNSRRLEQKVTI